MSLSTLDRRIASGDVRTKREPRGQRHRVYVMLDDDPPSAIETPQSEMAVARERIRGLEEQVAFLERQLEIEQVRNAELVNEFKMSIEKTKDQQRRGSWWPFWQDKTR